MSAHEPSETNAHESLFDGATDRALDASKVLHLAGEPTPGILAPFEALNGAHELLHGHSPVERALGGYEALTGGIETAELLGHGASALSGVLGQGAAAETIGGVGETLIAGSEAMAPVAAGAGLGMLAFGGGYALGTGADWLLGKICGTRPSDALANWMGARQDRAQEQKLGTHFYTDASQRGAQHIGEHGFSLQEYVHNGIYKMNQQAKGLEFDPQVGTWMPKHARSEAQAEPFAHYAA